MILQSLLKYYEILSADSASDIARPGWSSAKVTFAAVLSTEGTLERLYSLKTQEQRGKKTVEVAQTMLVPEQVKKTSGVSSNFLCENAAYMFGIDSKGNLQRTLQCFAAFRALHMALLRGLDVPEARAIIQFLEHWSPENAPAHPVLSSYLNEFSAGANLVFRLEGGGFAHQVPEIRRAWETSREKTDNSAGAPCLVCGEHRPIARLHPSIKGVRGAQAMGASVVSFNAPAYESYGKDSLQGFNAPVSEYAAFAYTTVLNHLLSDTAHKLYFGDTTVVYWADCAAPIYQNLFAGMIDPTPPQNGGLVRDAETERLLQEIFEKVSQGRPVSQGLSIDPSIHFYVLGLAPNAARLSVRFFLQDHFGAFLDHLEQHYLDLRLEHAPFEREFFPVWRLLGETVSPSSKDKSASPLLSGSVLRAILSNTTYPEMLYTAILRRIFAEHTVSYYKAAVIKACLLRKSRNSSQIKQEVLTVALNETSTHKAYILGRLFSVLEKLQQDANPGINSTIRDRYFTSACAAPGTVFPTLLRLSNHHISKAQYGYVGSRRIEELLNKLDMTETLGSSPFPAHLNLDEQGIFILGYYHQNQANFAANNKQKEEIAQ